MLDIVCNLEGPTSSSLDSFGNTFCRRALMLDGQGYGSRDFAYMPDRLSDSLDRSHGLARGALHVGDVRADLARGFCGLTRQIFDFLGNHREAATGIAGARRFDRGIKRQEVSLFCNRRDQLYHVSNPIA